MKSFTSGTNYAGVGKLWLLNLLGNAAALAVAYCWLLIPDAHGWQVAVSALVAVTTIFLVAWLRAGTFAHFRLGEFREQSDLGPAFRRGLRHIIPLMIWAALGGLLVWWFLSLREYTPQFGVWLRQKLDAGPTPRYVTQAANWLIGLVVFVLLAVWLPIASTIAAVGLRGVSRSLRVLRRCIYWLWLVIFILICGYIPYRLVWWIPSLVTLRAQAWSMGLRFLIAYALAVTGWIALVWMVGVFVEREDSQPDDYETRELAPPASIGPIGGPS